MRKMSIAAIAALVGVQMVMVVKAAHAGFVGQVPEPNSLALLGLGAGALAIRAWWRNRK